MKITVTEHELSIILHALRAYNTLVTINLAEKINAQSAADDGPEVAILQEGWDQ